MNIKSILILFLSIVSISSGHEERQTHDIKSVTVDQSTVCAGNELSVDVEVRLRRSQWYSTRINGECFSHDGHTAYGRRRMFVENFTIQVPNLLGETDILVETFSGLGCDENEDSKDFSIAVAICGEDGEDGDDCTIERGQGFAVITCGDTSSYVYDGVDGVDGQDGEGCTVSELHHGDGFLISCGDGTSVTINNGNDGEDGLACWDLNGNGEKDFASPRPWFCDLIFIDYICDIEIFTEDTNGDGIIDVLDCRGQDGQSCDVNTVDNCAVVTCGEEFTSTICDGQDGDDGVNGTSCYVVQEVNGVTVVCDDSDAFVANGTSCWDTNNNGIADICDPLLISLFNGECPELHDFFIEYECEYPPVQNTKAMQVAKGYGGQCGSVVTCEEYISWNDDAVSICAFTEDVNSDGVIDAVDCRGQDGDDGDDGQSCFVRVGRNSCAYIYCGDDTSAVICDGADGVDGVDGTSCSVQLQTGGAMITCGESQVFVPNGLNCWDMNNNSQQDLCHPRLASLFHGECPNNDDFFIETECEHYLEDKLLKGYDDECGNYVTCEEYLSYEFELDTDTALSLCNFTEDSNMDGTVDVLDCRGDDGETGLSGGPGRDGLSGPTGPTGPQGPQGDPGYNGSDGSDGQTGLPGRDGTNGADGEDCDVIDNGDATCTIACPESQVLVYGCGTLRQPDNTTNGPNPCGAFGGITLLGLLAPLGFLMLTSKHR